MGLFQYGRVYIVDPLLYGEVVFKYVLLLEAQADLPRSLHKSREGKLELYLLLSLLSIISIIIIVINCIYYYHCYQLYLLLSFNVSIVYRVIILSGYVI